MPDRFLASIYVSTVTNWHLEEDESAYWEVLKYVQHKRITEIFSYLEEQGSATHILQQQLSVGS